jgi:DNA ligase D
MSGTDGESREGVSLTNLDQPLFADAGVTKRDLVDYVDAMSERIIPVLRDRPLSVIRVTGDQPPFMQKNLPKYAPSWIETAAVWADASKRTVTYALCNDRRTLLWFANQRAVELHPTLSLAVHLDQPTALVIDLDPPVDADFAVVVRTAHLVREALAQVGLVGALKTSGAKGVHIVVPVAARTTADDAGAATRAIARRVERLDPGVATTAFMKEDREGKVFVDATRAGGATVAAVYSPRARPGLPVSFPVAWDDLDGIAPSDFTIRTVPELIGQGDPWAAAQPAPQTLSPDLLAEGHEIPIPRVAAMHEGKRRARTRRAAE